MSVGMAIAAPGRAHLPKSSSGSPPMGPGDVEDGSMPMKPELQQRSVSSTSAAPPRAVMRLREQGGRNVRSASLGMGMGAVAGDDTKSWSDLPDPSATIPIEGKINEAKGKPSMLGFLTRKHGRGQSPRPQERGVLGREGARHIVS